MNDIIDKIDAIKDDIISTASDLIKIPSRNPPGEEKECIEYIKSRLEEYDLNIKIIYKPFKDRPQIIAWNEEPRILLNGHVDTVPEGNSDLWSIDPFSGIIKDGKLYGRGAVDMKSALAIMIHIPRIIDRHLLLTFAIGEERAEPGTLELLKHIPNDVRYGIVLEPTSLAIAPYQRGALWAEMNIRGKATHASLPEKGINAIIKAKKIIDKIEEYQQILKKREALNTTPTCNVTMIEGGIKENVIPDLCRLIIDRRILPNEEYLKVIDELKSIHEFEIIAYRKPVKLDKSSYICNILKQSLLDIIGDAKFICFPGSTDNEHIIDNGIESIVWGPGDLADAHSIDESIDIKELITATKVLALSLYRFGKE
ncbi:MAG: succinyl-diaminopimelate desuccinylase [Candidatus Nitrosocaldaceae archaeon]|nr:MAG: succinyl-diaminopimelate desuccinylase [Candidatus Nitrosocaldaceae archaeon]